MTRPTAKKYLKYKFNSYFFHHFRKFYSVNGAEKEILFAYGKNLKV